MALSHCRKKLTNAHANICACTDYYPDVPMLEDQPPQPPRSSSALSGWIKVYRETVRDVTKLIKESVSRKSNLKKNVKWMIWLVRYCNVSFQKLFLSKIYFDLCSHKKFIFKCEANYYFCMLKNGGGSKANMVCFAIKIYKKFQTGILSKVKWCLDILF